MSGVQILSVINIKLQVVRRGTVRIYFLKKKRILNTVLHVEYLLISKLDSNKHLVSIRQYQKASDYVFNF